MASRATTDRRCLETVLPCGRSAWGGSALGSVLVRSHLGAASPSLRRGLENLRVSSGLFKLPGALLWVVEQRDRPVETDGTPAIPERCATATGQRDAPGFKRLLEGIFKLRSPNKRRHFFTWESD